MAAETAYRWDNIIQEENVRLEEVLDSREVEILDIANNLKITQIELTNEVTVSESLRLLLDELQSRLNYQQSMIIKLIYELDFITQEKLNALYDNEKMNKELLETNDRLQIQNETIAIMEEQLGNYTKTAAISNDENKKSYFF